jgi:hypothetical protein
MLPDPIERLEMAAEYQYWLQKPEGDTIVCAGNLCGKRFPLGDAMAFGPMGTGPLYCPDCTGGIIDAMSSERERQ